MTALPPFVDLHNHLVPGVDDGAANVAESVDALRELYAEGVRTLVATPHLLVPRLATDGAIGRELDLQRRAFDRLAEAAALASPTCRPSAWARRSGRPMRPRSSGSSAGPTSGWAARRAMLVEFGFELRGTHLDVVHAAVRRPAAGS